jgi:branched-chain amino acid transport system substrate-binding protein
VHALFGAYFSSVTITTSQVAERAGVPFVNGTSTSPALHRRGFKYYFRTTPHGEHFGTLMFDFVRDFAAKSGQRFETVAIFNEDTAFGSDAAKAQDALAKARGMKLVERIAYRAQTTSLTSEVQRLKAANPDLLLPTSYTSDTYLFLRTAKDLDYNPRMLVANNAGYTDPAFLKTMGKDGEGVMSRSPYNDDLAKRIPLIGRVNEIFRKHSGGRDISDVSAREFTAFMTLLDAIDRAGSTDPEKIRDALVKTNIPADQLIVPFGGIRFAADGQNELVRGLIMQVQDGKYCTVYPFELAACEVKFPMPTWAEKK